MGLLGPVNRAPGQESQICPAHGYAGPVAFRHHSDEAPPSGSRARTGKDSYSMKVLFVYSNRVRDMLPAPPVGLSYVVSATADAGHRVQVVDLLMTPKGLEKLRKALRNFQPHAVAVSVRNIDNVVHQRLTTHLDELRRQTRLIRAESSAPIILGGPAISILGSDCLSHIDADFAVLGEGEHSFPALLGAIEKGADPGTVAGVCARRDGTIVDAVAQRSRGFGPSGMERWIDWKTYERLGATWPIQSKRGCPLHCTYCTYPTIEGRPLRRRPAREIVDEIARVAQTIKPRCFEFVDSVFNMPEDYAIELCEAIADSGLKVNLTTMGVNPRFMSRDLLMAMKRAGFRSMMITPESASDPVLKSLRKGFTREDVLRCARLVQESGLASMWFFMLGAPGETRETAEETIAFAETHLNWKNCLPMFTTGIRILPGTELAARARADGYLSPRHDLAESVFYFSPQVSEEWLLRRVDQAIRICPGIVHAAEDPSGTPAGIWASRMMHLLGVAPPYWRFIPGLLNLRLVHRSRIRSGRRFPDPASPQARES